MLESRHEIKPLDLVLFKGDDAVARYIRKVTRTKVRDPSTFFDSNVFASFMSWLIICVAEVGEGARNANGGSRRANVVHAGILVDSTVLDHPSLEPNKLYIYESVFSGKVLGFEYSKTLPVDHEVSEGSYHLGPQIREFSKVVDEVCGQVAICPLHPEERRKLEADKELVRRVVTEFHMQYSRWTYPLAPIKQLAAASTKLYNNLMYLKSQMIKYVPIFCKPKDPYVKSKGEIFCSELVALLYRKLNIEAFTTVDPGELTPVEVEAMPAFGGRCLLVKSDGKVLLEEDGRTVLTSRQYSLSTLIVTLEHANYWSSFQGPEIPPSVPASGHDATGDPLYISRARIGQGIIPGGKTSSGILRIPWEDTPLKITYDHEMLTSMDGMAWVRSDSPSTIPDAAVLGGRDEEGRPLFIIRAEVTRRVWVFKKRRAVCIGNLRKDDEGGGVVPFQGKVRRVKKDFEVLVFTGPPLPRPPSPVEGGWKGLMKSVDKLKASKSGGFPTEDSRGDMGQINDGERGLEKKASHVRDGDKRSEEEEAVTVRPLNDPV
ncbi:hypothetical protein HDU67_009803 [Dinochytrium kinnereticum]|nr:hypothetical protein HDU67_009803 [Dinochytrium kinnereticum]